MSPFDVLELKKYLPARALTALKPYYRKFFPNRLIVMMDPTWRCNYACSYCPIVSKFAYTSVVDKSGELSGEKWLEGLDKLPPAAICILGGEPFVYADLPVIINSWPKKHHLLAITTNLSQPEHVYRRIEGEIKLIASLHREYIEPEPFVSKIKLLADQFQIHVNLVATPENLRHLDRIADELKSVGVTLHVDPFVDVGFQYTSEQMNILRRHVRSDRHVEDQLNYNDYSPKKCSAGRNYIVISPDGTVYTCQGGMNFIHSHQFAELVGERNVSQYRLRNLFDPEFHLNQGDIICSMPCNTACDRDSAIIRAAEIEKASSASAGNLPGQKVK
jgi:radical SAM protein with 4Fe4S-binding SPASM domain